MLVNAEINGIPAMVCINKSDLANSDELQDIYRRAGYDTVCVSALEKNGLDDLYRIIKGKTAAFAGVSGVGKSTILSYITGVSLETGEVSDKISRGRHTTRHVELFKIDGGGYVLDTPGFSSVETEEISADALSECFPEIYKVSGQCRFRGCSHINEPDCAVKLNVESGDIPQSRYQSYKELYEIQRGKKIWK